MVINLLRIGNHYASMEKRMSISQPQHTPLPHANQAQGAPNVGFSEPLIWTPAAQPLVPLVQSGYLANSVPVGSSAEYGMSLGLRLF